MAELTQILGGDGFRVCTATTMAEDLRRALDRLGQSGQESLYQRYGGGTLKQRPLINPLTGENEKDNPGFSLFFNGDGKLLWKSFRSDSHGDLYDFIREVADESTARMEFGLDEVPQSAPQPAPQESAPQELAPQLAPQPATGTDDNLSQRQHAKAMAYYKASVSDAEAIALYLRRREITLPIAPTILFHPQQKAMVAPVQNVYGERIGIHRTWFARGEKGMLGPVAGGAVRLQERMKAVLFLGEGIETVLSVMQARASDMGSAWAALSTSGLKNIQLPDTVTHVCVLADCDKNQAGQKAARHLAQRLLKEGKTVQIVWPCDPDSVLTHSMDFNDLLREDPSGESIRDRFHRAPFIKPSRTNSAGDRDDLGSCEEIWPDPEPLQVQLKPVQPFKYQLLPDALRPWVKDIAERMQCPPDFIAVSAMISMAAILGNKIAIQPKSLDDWFVVPNLWGLLVGRPSVMKTPALNEGLQAIERLQSNKQKEYKRLKKDWVSLNVLKSLKLDAAKDKAKKAVRDGSDDDALSFLVGATKNNPEEPTPQRTIVTDVTVEKLGELLSQNPNGLLLKRDEISSFLNNLERPENASERSFYMEAFNGYGPYVYDRVVRGTIQIESMTLSLIGTIQPARLSAYTHAALHMSKNDDGLIQRFQLAVYPDPVTEWTYMDRRPNHEAFERAWQTFKALDDLETPEKKKADQAEGSEEGAKEEGAKAGKKKADQAEGSEEEGAEAGKMPKPFLLSFTPEAQKMFFYWLTELEASIRVEDIHPAIEAHLVKYRSLGPSLALILHLADGQGLTPIGLDAATRAFVWCDYLRSHMERIYGSAVDLAQIAADALLKKIQQGKLSSPFKVRDVRKKGWTGLDSVDIIKAGVHVLEEHGYIKAEPPSASIQGGRPTVRYACNPKVLSKAWVQHDDDV